MKVTGYPVVVNVASIDLNGFREVVRPSALDRLFRENTDIVSLFSHDPAKPLGRRSTGSLQLMKDIRGLLIDLEVDTSTSFGHDAIQLLTKGTISGGSFGFRALDDRWSLDAAGYPLRELLDMQVSEISIVTFPAYSATRLMVSQGSVPASRSSRSVALAERELQLLLAR